MRSTPSLTGSPALPLKRFQCSSDWRSGPFSFFSGKISSASFFNPSPPGDQWCDILGFVPTGHVSNFSTFQSFQTTPEQATCEGCFAHQSICSVVSIHFGMFRVVHPQSFLRWILTIDTFQSGLPISFFTFCRKLIESGTIMACVVDAAEGMGDCFHLHCQAGGWDRIGCTVFMDGSRTLLDSDVLPSLVFGDWAISVHTLWGLAVCCFLKWEAWSLTLFCLLAILDSAFPGFLAGVSRRDAGIGLGTFPTPWFA